MDKKGFTLIEVVVSLAILSGAVMMLLASFNYHLGVASQVREDVLTAVLATGKMQELRMEGYAAATEGTFGEPFTGYRWSIVKEDSGLEGVKRLELKVGHEKGRALSLVSFIQER